MPDEAITKVRLFGLEFDNLTVRQIIERCTACIRDRTPKVILTPNVAMLVQWRKDTFLQHAYKRTDFLTIDGQALVYAGRLVGKHPKEAASGSLLFDALLNEASKHGYCVYLLGARPDVLDKATMKLCERYSDLKIVGTHHGHFSSTEASAVAKIIAESNADILLVGMSSPLKEKFMLDFRDEMKVPVALGVGGMFDIASGRIHRAPRVIQKLCLEWVWRLAQEPRRLWKRYLISNAIFLGLFIRELASERIAPLLAAVGSRRRNRGG